MYRTRMGNQQKNTTTADRAARRKSKHPTEKSGGEESLVFTADDAGEEENKCGLKNEKARLCRKDEKSEPFHRTEAPALLAKRNRVRYNGKYSHERSCAMQVTGRFAPSPSGRIHLGNMFCSLLAWLSETEQGAV